MKDYLRYRPKQLAIGLILIGIGVSLILAFMHRGLADGGAWCLMVGAALWTQMTLDWLEVPRPHEAVTPSPDPSPKSYTIIEEP